MTDKGKIKIEDFFDTKSITKKTKTTKPTTSHNYMQKQKGVDGIMGGCDDEVKEPTKEGHKLQQEHACMHQT
eukprot:5188985-Ditylum_brightwellii.AAC.1